MVLTRGVQGGGEKPASMDKQTVADTAVDTVAMAGAMAGAGAVTGAAEVAAISKEAAVEVVTAAGRSSSGLATIEVWIALQAFHRQAQAPPK